MTLRRVMLGSCCVAIAAACSTFSSTDTTPPPDAGADAAPTTDGGAAEDAALDATFHCPAPAGSCAFQREVCCFASEGGIFVGRCVQAGATCELDELTVSCDSPGPCRGVYDSGTAACCSLNGLTSCRRDGCGGDREFCRTTVMPAECSDASASCIAQAGGYGACE